MDAPDIIYVVRPGERNDSLKFSLRSLGHLPHRRVFIAGYCPSWVKNVTKIPVHRGVNKFDNIEANLRAALNHPELGERSVYFNDDFYVTQPIDLMPVMHRGPVDLNNFRQELRTRMATTLRVLQDVALDYELHVPLPLLSEHARASLLLAPKRILWRTWYGNMAPLGGDPKMDVKSRGGMVYPGPFLSSAASSLSAISSYLNDHLPRRSAYE